MGIHTGEPTLGEERYIGLGVHRAARICAAGHGGQVVISQTTRELLRDDPLPDVSLRDLGEHRLEDLDEAEHLYQLVAPGLTENFPPLRTAGSTPFAGHEGELAEAAVEELGSRWRHPGRRALAAAALVVVAVAAGVAVLLTQRGSARAAEDCGGRGRSYRWRHRRLAAQIPVGAAPSGVAAGDGAIWVTNTGS